MEHHKITCDQCEADITTRTNSVDYRLRLSSEMKPGHGLGGYTDMMIHPAIERDHHFCGMSCLSAWTDAWKAKRKAERDEWAAQEQAWEARRATMPRGSGIMIIGSGLTIGPSVVLPFEAPKPGEAT